MSSTEAREIAKCLRGTADGDLLALIEERGFQLEADRICEEVDELVFQCATCSRWCDISEESELICEDCADGN